MSVINAFLSTWTNARQTFGEGSPQTGAHYDNSGALRGLESNLESAAPGSRWTGTASAAYDTANTEHRRVIGQLAGLDQRLAAEVDQSAQVVDTGRRNLDSVRQWVVDAAASVPPGQAGEQMKMAIAQKGLTQLQEIVQKSNGDLNSIGGRIRGIGTEYQALGDQKFAPKEGPQFVGGEKKAEQDVQDTLAGDQEAAKRVATALNDIKPGQPLTPEQGSYLSQMQAQQKGMTVEELTTAEQRLGEQKHIIGDSWQLMSNPKVQFPKAELNPEALDDPSVVLDGSKTLLPDSVQHALNRDGLDSISAKLDPLSARTENAQEVSAISDIVRDGNQDLQQGTQLDDAMVDWSRDTMHDQTKPGLLDGLGLTDGYDQYADARDDALADVFDTAGRDHASVSAELTSDTGQQFLTDLHTHVWADTPDTAEKRQSTHTLLSWIGDEARSPNEEIATRAGAAAHALAENLDTNHDQYLKPPPLLGATPNVANLSPELIAADAIALAPYQDALVGDLSGTRGFEKIGEPGTGDLDAARNVFAVIDSDPGAAKVFNAAAEQKILGHQQAFADAAAAGAPLTDTEKGDLKRAAFLLGAVNGGAEQEAVARGLQGAQTDRAIYDVKKAGLDYLFENIPGHDLIPGIDLTRDTIETGILGTNPEPGSAQPNIPTYSPQQAINSTSYQVAAALGVSPEDSGIPAQYFSPDGHLKSPDRIVADDLDLDAYSTSLQRYLFDRGFGDLDDDFDRNYEDGAGK